MDQFFFTYNAFFTHSPTVNLSMSRFSKFLLVSRSAIANMSLMLAETMHFVLTQSAHQSYFKRN